MSNWLRRGLDSYEDQAENRDEEFAGVISKHLDAMSDRRTLKLYTVLLACVNCVIWLSVLIFPRDIRLAWNKVFDIDPKIAGFVIAIILGLGLWMTYALIRRKLPDIEEVNLDSEVFGSLAYSAKANRRFLVWLFSSLGGVINAIALVLVIIALTSG